MSQENVEIVRRYYEATNKGEHDSVAELMAPDIELDASRRRIEPGVWRGREEVLEAARKVRDAWQSLSVEPEELIPVGDRVVALVLNTARGKASGAAVESRTGQVWTVRDGKLVRFEYFGTPEEALEAVGLAE